MSTLFKKIVSLMIVLGCGTAGPLNAQQSSVDNYVREALRSNESLAQQQFQLEKALFALKEARSLFLPSVSLLGSYNKAAGGRTIDFPIGDLLNPVYNTLNQLTSSQVFPTLENASILLNPDNFYDAKFRTTLPLINAEIWYNKQVKQQQLSRQQATVNVYKRQLVKDVKDACYHYYQSGREVGIYENALKLVLENIRVNESLYRNGTRNHTALTRAQAEKERIAATLTQAQRNNDNARMYVNFLLNRDLAHEVPIDTAAIAAIIPDQAGTADVSKREELQQLSAARSIYTLNRGLQRAHLVPKVNTYLDLGSQAFGARFDNRSRYYMWGINFQWDLFASNQYRYKARQAEADIKTIASQEEQTRSSLQLQLQSAGNNYAAATAAYNSAIQQVQLTERYYQDQLKTYKEGQLLYLELIDAQNQLINAQLQLAVAIANIHIAAAEIERCTASYPI